MATPAQIVVQQSNLDQQRRHTLEDAGRQQTLEFNQGILNNPDAPDEQKLQARQNIQGLYPTPAHAPQFLLDLLHIKHRQANQPTAAAQKDAQSTSHGNAVTNTPPTPGDGGSESTTPGPAPAANPVQAIQSGAAPQVPAPASQPASPAPVAQVRQVAQAQTPQDALAQIRAYASPAQASNTLTQKTQGAIADRMEKVADIRGKYQVEAAKARGSSSRPVHIGDVTPQDAIKNMSNLGYEYLDENDNPITAAQLSEAPQYTKLVEFRQGPKSFFKLVDQNSKMWNIGGVDYQAGTLGKQTPETLSALGQTTSTLPKFHQVPGMNPGEKIDLTSGTAQTPGITAPASSATPLPPGAAIPNPTLKQRPQPTSTGTTSAAPPKTTPVPLSPPALPPSPSQQAIVNHVNKGRSQSKQIPAPSGEAMPPAFAPGTMLQQGRAAQPVVSAMSVVASNIFGAHGDKPIWDNAWMYDKPELRQALNNALTLNALHIPGTEENPSLMESLKTAVGATQWSQEQINQAAVQARQEVERLGGPEALKQFSRMAAMQEDLSALRTATKASAAQGSLNLAVRAAPVYNIASSQDFRNQLGTMLSTAVSSMHGYPAINPAYVNWWDKGVNAAKSASTPAANATPARPPHVPADWTYNVNGPKGKGWYAPTAASTTSH